MWERLASVYNPICSLSACPCGTSFTREESSLLTKLPQLIGGSHELCEWAVDNTAHEALLVSAGLRTTFNDSLQTRSGLSGPMYLVPINEESQADGLGCCTSGLLLLSEMESFHNTVKCLLLESGPYEVTNWPEWTQLASLRMFTHISSVQGLSVWSWMGTLSCPELGMTISSPASTMGLSSALQLAGVPQSHVAVYLQLCLQLLLLLLLTGALGGRWPQFIPYC